ncbi:MAG: hypothetical protein UW09_C0001G0029 [candidate division TM6 bacterium GW2011_GWF2_43_87]|nr:MAG: hypothetical protein UW09_C0001G0029 [candidate division TM6 bacterium GW2011_GWF2_43_87]
MVPVVKGMDSDRDFFSSGVKNVEIEFHRLLVVVLVGKVRARAHKTIGR